MSPLLFILILLILTLLPTLIYIVYLRKCPTQPSDPPCRPVAGGLFHPTIEIIEKLGQKMNILSMVVVGGGGDGGKAGEECPVCLSGFGNNGKEIRQLSLCKHMFHGACIDKWLCSHSSCPVCRAFVSTKLIKESCLDLEKQ
ncbi:hypothetical protein Droror1_Dr00026097 [Drosera rotundifolia]